jgi:exopolyphosphatase/guanosine-5'-triphosphate,3'-diphosphate pyrophosphatase
VKRPRKRASSVAVIDIGSNSVRLVVYETMARSLVTIFNEKALCGLGREVQSTGLLAEDAVAKALTALRRFRALCRIQQVGRVFAIAIWRNVLIGIFKVLNKISNKLNIFLCN